jgi:hypothetical protein
MWTFEVLPKDYVEILPFKQAMTMWSGRSIGTVDQVAWF